MDKVRVVITTAPEQSLGERLVRTVVDERLAACGTVLPGAVSIYRWEGEVARAEEVLVVLKTANDSVETLTERLVSLHPYEVPEVLVVGVEGGHAPYLDWVIRECVQA